MNQDVKTLWVNALRSGEYEQVTGWLKRDGGFCCLGVLNDLYIKHTGRGVWTDGNSFIDGAENWAYTDLAPKVSEWAGLDTCVGKLPEPVTAPNSVECKSLMDCNDAGTMNFQQIADVIEKQF